MPLSSLRRRRRRLRPALLEPPAVAAVCGLAVAGFLALSALVYRGRPERIDRPVRGVVLRRRGPRTRRLARAIEPIGKPYGHGPAALLLALWLHARTGSAAGGGAVVGASAAAALLSRALERWIRQRPPPPGRHKPDEPSFPSGHALETAAVALTAAHVLQRERLLPTAATVALAVTIPALSGVGKLVRDRHWATDVAGGWLAGVAVATGCVVGYELRGVRGVGRRA